jgi:hypothetical protein
MLRRIPSTPLVCIAISVAIICLNTAWAADPDKSLEILLKPNQPTTVQTPTIHKIKAMGRAARHGAVPYPYAYVFPPPPSGITKVKPAFVHCGGPAPCILPSPKMRQWEMSAQALFARTRGTIAWPRYTQYYVGWQGWNNEADLNGALKLPEHQVIVDLSARYQFRPNWGVRYEVLWDEINGGGYADQQFIFGPWWGSGGGWIVYGQQIQTKWQHAYHRLSLVYDALRTCQSSVSVSAGWAHADDKIGLNCVLCGLWTTIFSKSMDSMIAGIECQRCLKTAPNGGSLSTDLRAQAIFLDDVEGYDLQAAGRYSVPLNCGRSGYVKGGYRFVQLKKSETDFLFSNTLEGGFIEGGLIF